MNDNTDTGEEYEKEIDKHKPASIKLPGTKGKKKSGKQKTIGISGGKYGYSKFQLKKSILEKVKELGSEATKTNIYRNLQYPGNRDGLESNIRKMEKCGYIECVSTKSGTGAKVYRLTEWGEQNLENPGLAVEKHRINLIRKLGGVVKEDNNDLPSNSAGPVKYVPVERENKTELNDIGGDYDTTQTEDKHSDDNVSDNNPISALFNNSDVGLTSSQISEIKKKFEEKEEEIQTLRNKLKLVESSRIVAKSQAKNELKSEMCTGKSENKNAKHERYKLIGGKHGKLVSAGYLTPGDRKDVGYRLYWDGLDKEKFRSKLKVDYYTEVGRFEKRGVAKPVVNKTEIQKLVKKYDIRIVENKKGMVTLAIPDKKGNLKLLSENPMAVKPS